MGAFLRGAAGVWGTTAGTARAPERRDKTATDFMVQIFKRMTSWKTKESRRDFSRGMI